MPTKRKNKAAWVGVRSYDQPWYIRNIARQRKRNKIAKISRRKNR